MSTGNVMVKHVVYCCYREIFLTVGKRWSMELITTVTACMEDFDQVLV